MRDDRGTIYVLHLSRPMTRGATHYLGFTTDFENRMREHRNGSGKSKFMAAAKRAGITFEVGATFEGTFADETKIKKRKESYKRLCDICKAKAEADDCCWRGDGCCK